MKRVLVINPWAADFKLYDEWMHPLGLYFLCSLLEQNSIEWHFFNCLSRGEGTREKRYATGDFGYRELPKPQVYHSIKRRYKLYGRSPDKLVSFCTSHGIPQVVYIGSAMTYWYPGLEETVRAVRTVLPDVPVIIGGISASLMPSFFRERFPGCIVVPGGLFDSYPDIPGLQDLRWETSERSFAAVASRIGSVRHGPVLTSLGCPMRCAYCASSLLQPDYRTRPAETVISEIRAFAEQGAVDFALYDDALLYRSADHFVPLLRKIMAALPGLRFHVPNGIHLKYLDSECAEFMREAGFVTLRFGYESGAGQFSKYTAGKSSHEEIVEKIAIVAHAGFDMARCGVYVMGGLDGQLPRDMLSEMDFVASLGIRVQPVFISPVPGTVLFKTFAQKFPQLLNNPLWHNDTFFITQLPGWGEQEVEEVRMKAKKLNADLVKSRR
jgi:radical SAM superfamily enzyme YgiQ (UPF0313 family)